VPLSVEGDVLLSPESSQHIDLFLDSLASIGEVFVKRFVLHPVSSDPHAEP